MVERWTVGGRDIRRERFALEQWRQRKSPRILVCGDSYSDTRYIQSEPGFSWIVELEKRDSRVYSKALAGASNWHIWHQLKEETWDLAIVNLAPLHRVVNANKWDKEPPQVRNRREEIKEHNSRYAKSIIELPAIYVWSPFTEYESWEQVEYKDMFGMDEKWGRWIDGHVTGNHYTQKGNEQMLEWVQQVISETVDG